MKPGAPCIRCCGRRPRRPGSRRPAPADVLLIDHANCEKKAASTALALMFAYAEDLELTDKMSRLAREELRHYEQVAKLMKELQSCRSGWRPAAMRSACVGWSRRPSRSARSI